MPYLSLIKYFKVQSSLTIGLIYKLILTRHYSFCHTLHTLFTLLLFALILSPQKSHSQTYPVQLNVQLQPPFSGYLPDYTTPGSEQLKLFVLFTDFTRPSYDIKLKFRLQGQGITIENPAYFYAGPFTVEPGVPLQLSGTDLAQLMAQQNLVYSGITTQQYNQRRVLPEGFYTICVTAYDYLNPTPIQVSNEACTQAWMIISDPPLPNLPLCGSTVPEIQPQQITFSWTPLNMGGPSSALGTEYVLRLWEIRPNGNPAGNVIASSPPVDSIVTSLTVANYTQLNYPLIDGMEYVWTVQARDAGGRELFRNRGMSAPCTFTWGSTFGASAASINLNLAAQVINHRQARLTWDSVALFANYRVEFRAQNFSPNWYPAGHTPTETDNAVRLYNLTPERTYEARVRGNLPNGQPGAWSDIVTFTTPAEAIIVCGQTAPAPSMQNFKPLTTATIGMTWQIGQFEMLVTQLQSISNPQGYYSGLGKIKMFGVIGVACSFQNIRMNEQLQMVAGEVHALTDGIDNWLAQGNGIFDPPNINYHYQGSIDSVVWNNGQIQIFGQPNDTTITVNTYPYVIADANGTIYSVNADGSITISFAVQHVELSQAQINVYQEALNQMRSENSLQVIQQKANAKNQARQNLIDYQKNTLGIDYSQPAPTVNNTQVMVWEMEEPAAPDTSGPAPPDLLAQQAEFEWIKAQVCRRFARTNPTTYDYDILATLVLVNGTASYIYIAQQLVAGASTSQIAAEVKNGIYQFLDQALLNELYVKPKPE
jgi:hypothetical protein